MTVAEANATIRLLRYLLDPDNVITAEQAADDAEYLAGRAQLAVLAGPRPAQVREWMEAHAARLRDAEAERDALRAQRNNAVATVVELAQRLTTREREHNADRAEMERLRTELADLQGQNALTEYHFTNYVDDAIEQRSALIALHEYDELIFGGFFCLHCTPDDCDDPDDNVYWPCPSLRAVGVTDEEAVALIKARRAENEARHRQTPAAGADDGTCGDCATGKCHGTTPDDCGCDRHNASTPEATP